MGTNNSTERPTPNVSRRAFVKNGLLAASAVGLGTAGTGPTAARGGTEVLVYDDDYVTETPFRVVSMLPATITTLLLAPPGGGNVPEIPRPDDYDGYAIRYERGGGSAATVFTKGTLEDGATYRFRRDATVYSSRLGLLSATVERTDARSTRQSG